MDRYEIPDLKNKIKVINTLIDRSNTKMKTFVELNKHTRFLDASAIQKMSHSYAVNIDGIRMSLNALDRTADVYGASSDTVYELVKRHDRLLIVTTDRLRIILRDLEDILNNLDV